MNHASAARLAVSILLVLGTQLSGKLSPPATPHSVKVESKDIRLEFNSSMHSRVTARFDGRETFLGQFEPSEAITIDGRELTDFTLKESRRKGVRDDLGSGRQMTLVGTSGSVQKTLLITIYDDFPQFAFSIVRYTNTGASDLKVGGWTNNRYSISAVQSAGDPPFWSKNRIDLVSFLRRFSSPTFCFCFYLPSQRGTSGRCSSLRKSSSGPWRNCGIVGFSVSHGCALATQIAA